jgi:hypothetical protein
MSFKHVAFIFFIYTLSFAVTTQAAKFSDEIPEKKLVKDMAILSR